jgi:hypothetical protein
MKFRRKGVEKNWTPNGWKLRLECGHEHTAHRPIANGSCEYLIGQQVQDHLGKRGRITGYRDGLFVAIAWSKGELSYAALDDLREKAEIVMAA